MSTAAPDRPRTAPFEDLALTPAHHFDLFFYAAVVRLRRELPAIDDDVPALAFLRAYFDHLPPWVKDDEDGGPADERWCAAIRHWERATDDHLPLRALRNETGLDDLAITLLFTAALADEDSRFATLFHALQPGGGHRPTIGLLSGWSSDPDDRRAARQAIARMLRLGLLEPVATDPPRSEWALQPSPPVWDVIRGDVRPDIVPWATYRGAEDALPFDQIVLAPSSEASVRALPRLVRSGDVRALIVRGPGASGRRTVLATVARALGRGHLAIEATAMDEHRWRQLALLCTVLGAMPVIRVDVGPGEIVEIPPADGYTGPLGVTLPLHGGVRGRDVERSVTLMLDMPDVGDRARHWTAALDGRPIAGLDAISERYRMSGGHIRRAAPLARAAAGLAGRQEITGPDVLEAGRTLRSRALETLATRVPVTGGWDALVVSDDSRHELRHVEDRCRSREVLTTVLPPAVGLRSAGVRILFTGPSGTGKTLAARLLASVLEMDLYAIDLSTVVDKFLGETEKHLTTVFERAAELDAVLLMDEGDALLTGRTDVRTSNDRYANLQTNHLLQLLESHDGIVVVTTNAGERIDGAFQRRMDATVEFRAPDPSQRWDLWQLHLPADHDVDQATLVEIATRCSLNGGQIRNAVLHAWLLAGGDGGGSRRLSSRHVDAAVRREYRKMGGTCPLRLEAPA